MTNDEADRSLLLDAALRALVEAVDADVYDAMGIQSTWWANLGAAVDAARAALVATDVRGALALALMDTRWYERPSISSHQLAEEVLAALAAKGVEG